MKARKLIVGVLAAALGASSFAQMSSPDELIANKGPARDPNRPQAEEIQRQGQRAMRQNQRAERNTQRNAQIHAQADAQRRHWENNQQRYVYRDRGGYYVENNRNYYGNQYSYNYTPRYAVGGYAPNTYWHNHRYYVNDWRARQLYAPPVGYQWVQTDTGELLLVALATGLIANVILASR